MLNHCLLYWHAPNMEHLPSFKPFAPGVNFIIVLQAAFTHIDPKCAKKTVKSALSFYAFRTLMKLNPGVNFINVLQAAFYAAYPKSAKIVKLSIIFELLGSARIKDAHRTLMKLTPAINYINILPTAFTCTEPKNVKRY